MAIYRIKHHERNFTIIGNRTIRDDRLSYRARGVHHHLLSLHDDTRFDATKLAEQSPKEGRTAIRTAMTELVDAGYVRYEKDRGDDGRFTTIVHVFEIPESTDLTPENGEESTSPESGEPTPVDLTLKRKTVEENTSEETPVASKPTQVRQPEVLSEHKQVMEALVAAVGWDRDEVTDNQWRATAKASKQLRDLPAGVQLDEIYRRAVNYRLNRPDVTLTPMALAGAWAESAQVRSVSRKQVEKALERDRWLNAGSNKGGQQ